MPLPFTIVFFAFTVLMSAAPPFLKRFRNRKIWPWVTLASILMTYGSLAWSANWLSSAGAFDQLPPTFEYPIWHAEGVLTLADGTHVVPHTASSRIQIYDRDWHYVRGWRIKTGGADFRLVESPDDEIKVFIERGGGYAVYDRNGRQLGVNFEGPRPTRTDSPERVTLPTALWLRPFSSLGLSWLIWMVGLALLVVASDRNAKRATPSEITASDNAAPEPRRDLP